MNYRYLEVQGLTSMSDGDILTVDLDMADPVSELLLDLRVTNDTGSDSTEHPVACFAKIELTDGSDVLFSLDGLELEALDIYHSGMYPRGGWFHYLPSVETDRQVAISFGRYLWDEELAFDPKRFANPKLRITFDADAGGLNVSSGNVSVLAAMFDEKVITPRGFLMTKEIKRWTAAATAHEYTDCPTDYPYRMMLLQARYGDVPPHWAFANIKLSSDQDKKVIFNGEFRDLMFAIGRKNAFIREVITGQGLGSLITMHCTPTMDVMGSGNNWIDTSGGGDVATYNGDGGKYQSYSEDSINTVHTVSGWAPHGTLCIPFGKQEEIDDWFDVRMLGSLKLDVTSGNASATQKLFIQQYRAY